MSYRSTKYHNYSFTADGKRFASKKEYKRYQELQLLERAGEIKDLDFQKKFVLIPAQRKHGRYERECSYIADFVYRTKEGELIVEDTKGVRTKDYIIKRKLMLWVHDIRIWEV